MIRTGHLFAGAGGGLYADLILGHTPVFAVEFERYPAELLRQRRDWFPELEVFEMDCRDFDPKPFFGIVDSIHAGWPCTDISVAGMGRGIEGERSGLWSEVVRCADAIRPGELFLENSPAITTRGLDRVLSDLSALGFNAEWCCLPAGGVGAPHRRDRWWCLARRPDADMPRRPQQREPVAAIEKHKTVERGSWWSIEPKLDRVANGIPNRVNRIKALGNGQVPLQAAMAYRLLESRYS